jgi:hypothetical protein
MPFYPGESGNPNGRKPGSRNRRTQEILDLIQARGDTDPLDALSAIVTTNKDPNIVATASSILAPYCHSKRGTLPAPRFLPEPVAVPTFTSITQAEDYLASIPVLLGRGEIDSQTALELSTLTKNWLDAIYAHQEYDLKLAAQGGGSDTTIRITGGLPPLPGSNIIGMGGEESSPHINGHTNGHTNGHGPVIDHQEPPALDDSSAASADRDESSAQEPDPHA